MVARPYTVFYGAFALADPSCQVGQRFKDLRTQFMAISLQRTHQWQITFTCMRSDITPTAIQSLSNVVILSRRCRVCHRTCRRWFSSQLAIYFYQVFAHTLWKAHSFAPILLSLFSLSLNSSE